MIPLKGSLSSHGKGACMVHRSYEPFHVGPPKMHGHSGEFRQTMIHWRRECKPPRDTCRDNLITCIKGQKDTTPKDESPRSEGVQYAPGEEQNRTTSKPRKKAAPGPKQTRCLVVGVSGEESRVGCCEEQHFTGAWTVRSMNQVNWTWS